MWDPGALNPPVLANSVPVGTQRQGLDGRLWVCYASEAGPAGGDAVAETPSAKSPFPSGRGSAARRDAGPKHRHHSGRLSSFPSPQSGDEHDDEPVAERKTQATRRPASAPTTTPTRTSTPTTTSRTTTTPTTTTTTPVSGRARTRTTAPAPAGTTGKAQHVWVLHRDECPVWRVPNKNGLDKHGWWRYSTIEGVDSFGVVECGATGNCLFDSILRGLQHNFTGFRGWTAARLRRLAARQITSRTVDAFLHEEIADRKVVGPAPVAARVSERAGGGGGGGRVSTESAPAPQHFAWDPRHALRIADTDARVAHVRGILSTPGNTYWGDALTLRLMCRSRTFAELDIGFVVLTPNGVAQVQFITSRDHLLGDSERHRPATIMLLYNSLTHWQLVCYYPERTRAVWEAVLQLPERADDLPVALRNVLTASWRKEWRLTLGYG